MKKITLILCLLGAYIAKGQLLDSVPIPNSDDSYAIYLPHEYNEDKKWPVIMIFTPTGNGRDAVKVFEESANRYGYVIAASNGVKNGNYQENLLKSRSFYTAVLDQYPIDKNAIYLAGFSGGARLATSIAVMSSQIKGVITCGASFSNLPAYIPDKNKFFYIGMVGDQDFNFNEMQNAMGYLEQKKFDADLLVFSGGHKWAPSNYIDKAVRLLTIKSINKNIRHADQTRINDYFEMELAFSQELIAENLVYRAYEDMNVNKSNYRFYIDKDSLRSLEKAIRKNRNYRKQRNTWNEVRRIENYKYLDYLNYLPQDVTSADLESLGFWENEIDSIKNFYSTSSVRAKENLGKRLLSF